MKFLVIVLSFLSFVTNPEIFAQEKKNFAQEQLFKDMPDTVLSNAKYKTSLEVGTSFMSDLRGGYGIENYISPGLSYLPSESLKFDFHATMGSVNFHNMSLYDYYNSTFLMSGINHYFGVAGQATYKLTDKLFISSGGFAEKFPELDPVRLQNKINYGGTILVGYKFTDKFSIQAGFEIQRFDDPWARNPFMYNHGFMP